MHCTSAKIYGPRRGGRVVQVRGVLPFEHIARSSTYDEVDQVSYFYS